MSHVHDHSSYIGKRFKLLTVISFIGIKKVVHKDRVRNKYIYKCLCNCGNTTEIASVNLNYTQSCGCIHKDALKIGHAKQRGKARPHVQKPNGLSVLHGIFLAYKQGAKKRKIDFKINENEFAIITFLNCYYCNNKPRKIKSKKDSFAVRYMNGIDRFDNDIGYIMSNCVPCCKTCNYMKSKSSFTDWLHHMKRIIKHQAR